MALGTLDRTPPPFFRQGPSALTKLCFCSALAAVPDGRRRALSPRRSRCAPRSRPCSTRCSGRCWCRWRRSPAAATTSPGWPARAAGEDAARQRRWRAQAERALRVDQLLQENARLRALLELRPGAERALAGGRGALRRGRSRTRARSIIDRGVTHNVALGSPVINEAGVLGQVTRVYLQSSEVTLLTDRDAAIPVLNSRTRRAQRRVRRRTGVGPAGDALHGRQRRRAGRRPAHHLGRRRRLPAGAAGRQGRRRSTARSTPASPASRSRPRPRPTACATSWCSSRPGVQLPPRPEAAASEPGPARARRRGPAGGEPARSAAMIMPRASDQLLLPVNPLFIWTTLALAFLLNIVPLGRVPAMPDFLALVLVFWNVHQSRRVGVGVAFVFGLLMDVHSGAVLGQHALAYTLLSFFAITIHRRLLWFTVPSQAVQILPLFVAAAGGVAAGADDRRRHVPGLGADPGAGVPGAALAGGDLAAARAAAPRARPGRESAAVSRRRHGARAPGRTEPAPLLESGADPATGLMTELRNTEHELSRFRLRLLAAALFVAGRLRPARRPAWPGCRSAQHDELVDPGREQPHRGRADHAQPRPDPRPQRRRPGQQLLGLHARDRAVQGRATSTRRSTGSPRWCEIQPRDRRRFKRLLEESKSFESLPIRTKLTDEEVARFTAQRFRFSGRRHQGAPVPQLSARRGRQPPDRLHRPHQPEREEGDGGRLAEDGSPTTAAPNTSASSASSRATRASCTAPTGFEEVEMSAGGHAVRRLRSQPGDARQRRWCCRSTSGCRRWSRSCSATGAARWWRSIRATARCWPSSASRTSTRTCSSTASTSRTGRRSTSRPTSRCSTGRCAAPIRRARPTSRSWRWPR